MNIKFHAVREAVRHGEVKVVKVRGGVSADTEQIADVFTKAPTAPMLRLLKTLMDGAAKIPLLARLYQ